MINWETSLPIPDRNSACQIAVMWQDWITGYGSSFPNGPPVRRASVPEGTEFFLSYLVSEKYHIKHMTQSLNYKTTCLHFHVGRHLIGKCWCRISALIQSTHSVISLESLNCQNVVIKMLSNRTMSSNSEGRWISKHAATSSLEQFSIGGNTLQDYSEAFLHFSWCQTRLTIANLTIMCINTILISKAAKTDFYNYSKS